MIFLLIDVRDSCAGSAGNTGLGSPRRATRRGGEGGAKAREHLATRYAQGAHRLSALSAGTLVIPGDGWSRCSQADCSR